MSSEGSALVSDVWGPNPPTLSQRLIARQEAKAAEEALRAANGRVCHLEEELAAGRITQAEYDELTGGISEEQFQAEEAADEAAAELSPEAERVMRGMRSSSGVEFAPWMKVDPEAIAKAKAEREARKARQQASQGGLRADAMLIDPQAAELGAGGAPGPRNEGATEMGEGGGTHQATRLWESLGGCAVGRENSERT